MEPNITQPDALPSRPSAIRPTVGEVALLEVVNSAYTADDLHSSLNAAGADPDLAQALLRHRGRIGLFRTIDDIADVEGLGTDSLEALVGAFGQPTLDPEAETLEYVIWTHGSTLTVQNPERFGQIDHRATGLRLHSFPTPRGEPFVFGRSKVTAAIATPAYALGKQFHVRSVLISMESDPAPRDVYGSVLATPTEASVWDGHHKMAGIEIGPFWTSINRFVRVPIASTHKVRAGVAVSLDVSLRPVPEHFPTFWLEINAVGIEFVTRSSGPVFTNE